MFADSLNNNDNSRVKNEYMKSGSSGSVGTKPKSGSKYRNTSIGAAIYQKSLLTRAQDSALESARSSESGEESRDISRSRRARVEQQQAKSKVKHAADESLLFDAAVKFYLRKVLSRMTTQIEKLDSFGQFTEEYYACTNNKAYTAHHLTSDEEWSIGLPVLMARIKGYQYDCINDFRHDFREMVTARLRSDALLPFSAEYQSSEAMLYEGLKLISNYHEYLNDKTVQQYYMANKQFDFKTKHVIAAIVERESDSECLLCGEEKTKHCLECRLCHDTYHTACLRMIDKHVPETDRNKWHCEKCQLLDQHHHMRLYLNQATTPQSPLPHHGTLTAFTLNIDTAQSKQNKKRKREDKEEEDPPQKKRRVTHRVKLPRATQQTVDPDKIQNNKDYARSIKWEPVDRILGRRLCNKVVQYKVMFRNKSSDEAKWVYHYQMQDCEEFVREFETKFADLIKKKQLETQMKRQKEGDKNKS